MSVIIDVSRHSLFQIVLSSEKSAVELFIHLSSYHNMPAAKKAKKVVRKAAAKKTVKKAVKKVAKKAVKKAAKKTAKKKK